ncbi:hypothetical protein [Halosegnis marinus]|uniref:hypothetical protein n=1 Tax=Halosegnis marinus TaxID=3034023 RepID=UPI00360E05C8
MTGHRPTPTLPASRPKETPETYPCVRSSTNVAMPAKPSSGTSVACGSAAFASPKVTTPASAKPIPSSLSCRLP